MKDRTPTKPGRVLLTPEDGSAPFYAVLTRADEPEEQGDAINKKNLLQDETAEAMGLDPADNPQVNDALLRLTYKHDNRFLIGDTLTTIRADLSDNWALCNGEAVYRDTGEVSEQFYKLLDPGVEPRSIAGAIPTGVGRHVTAVGNGLWCIYGYSSSKCILLDPFTGEYKEITTASGTALEGKIVGVVWDGTRYVLCTIYEYLEVGVGTTYSHRFYTSDDLETWTQAAQYTPSETPDWDFAYGVTRFVWDGAAYRVSCQESGYQVQNVHTYSADFEYLDYKRADYSDIYAADGLFVIAGSDDYNTLYLYEPGSITPLYSGNAASDDAYRHLAFEKYAENKYVMIPLGEAFTTLRFYDKESNTFSGISVASIASDAYYCVRVHLDAEAGELIFVLRDTDTGTNMYLARLTIGADGTDAANYRLSDFGIYDSTTITTLNDMLRWNGEWTYVTAAYSSTIKVAGPHPRALPAISMDGAYTYIKIKEGE